MPNIVSSIPEIPKHNELDTRVLVCKMESQVLCPSCSRDSRVQSRMNRRGDEDGFPKLTSPLCARYNEIVRNMTECFAVKSSDQSM